jgi:hypothetical protein
MPRFDGTGPMGQGPMTGRGRGYCAVPVNPTVSAAGPGGLAALPYYPANVWPPGVAAYGFPRIAYPRLGRGMWFGYGRGFGGRGGRGRGGRRRRW